MYLGVYFDDSFHRSLLPRCHAVSLPLTTAISTLTHTLQYDAINQQIPHYMDAEYSSIRQIAAKHIINFRLIATLQYNSMRCLSLKQLIALCASTYVLRTHAQDLHLQVHPDLFHFFNPSFMELDDLDKFSSDYS